MSATRYKKPHVDILICIEMTRERNLGIKKKHPVLYERKNNNNLMFARYESKSFSVQYSHLECIFCIPFSLGLGKKDFLS